MGDRTWTDIQFSGIISEEQAEELVELLEAQGCCANEGDDLLQALKDGSSFYDGEYEVGYCKTWEPGGGYGPGIELWRPGMERAQQCASVESSPVATFNELEKAHKAGKVAELIADLDRFNHLGPPLQVLAVDDWTPELCTFMAKRALEIKDA
jgi:hypothetical protein